MASFMVLAIVGVAQERTWMIMVGVLGAFGSLALAAYLPSPW